VGYSVKSGKAKRIEGQTDRWRGDPDKCVLGCSSSRRDALPNIYGCEHTPCEIVMSATKNFSKSYLSTATFVSRAYASVDQLSTSQFLMRKGKGVKRFVEEIMPIAAFLKHFEIPGRRVRCKHFPGNQNYDAKIHVQGSDVRLGFIEKEYFLEVTSAVSSYDFLEREALAHSGSVFGGGKIRREKGSRRILSDAVAEDHDASVIKASEWVVACLTDKANKQTYPQPCILLVQVEPERPLNTREWLTVIENVQGRVNRHAFTATYLVNAWRNVVLQI
jgi:hypothetical protein